MCVPPGRRRLQGLPAHPVNLTERCCQAPVEHPVAGRGIIQNRKTRIFDQMRRSAETNRSKIGTRTDIRQMRLLMSSHEKIEGLVYRR